MPNLIIRHLPTAEAPQGLRVERQADGKQGDAVTLTAPEETPIDGSPYSHLSAELRWYLEKFLDYPFPPDTDKAQRLEDALKSWGEQAFNALFSSGRGRDFYRDAFQKGLEKLTLKIASDDPRILAWPWEALCDPDAGSYLAHACGIERQLNKLHDPLDLPEHLPRDRINILLITARPFEADVGFRTLSRPLVELIQNQALPASIDLLRPPTFDRLCEHLSQHPGHYHIVHFDGHGGYGPEGAVASGDGNGHLFRGMQGRLIFEQEEGKPDAIAAEPLAALLREHRIPVMVLNACQSAMVDARAEDAFASVAAALLRAGVRNVVAMSYSLYVSGAEVFIPAFYRRLFASGSVTEAVRAGRQEMWRRKGRVCARGNFPLDDWLVPVVYQQDPQTLEFLKQAAAGRPGGRAAFGNQGGRRFLRFHRTGQRAAGTGTRHAPPAGWDSGSRPGRRRQDHPRQRVRALAGRHPRPQRPAVLVQLQRHPQQRVCHQPPGGSAVRHRRHGRSHG